MRGKISALVDFADPRQPDGPRLRQAFGSPRELLVAHRLADVRAVLDAAQAAAQGGAWCVGYLRYEAACAFDAALAVYPAEGPLAWFAVHDRPLPWPQPVPEASPRLQWQDPLQRPVFDAALAEMQRAIAGGEYYQVNFTAQMWGVLEGEEGSALALFQALQRAQPGGYSAFLDTGEEQLLSVSPELFFDWRDERLLTRPMKGTAPRGLNPEDDAAQAEALRSSPKERAENVMIVDLLRNDLSRIAEPFSVSVPRLFHTEALPAVWQMTSDVEARTRAGCSLADVFAALFPCGSVTGAPKVRAMRAIREWETAPRGVYCGAMGVLQPGGAATFNVPIRTVSLRGQEARCGIGSGITAGSVAEAEWQEWRHKRAFLERASTPFEILETLALEAGELRNLDEHLARMAASAAHFGTRWDPVQVRSSLGVLREAHLQGLWRVRLLLSADGKFSAQAYAMESSPPQVRLQLADRPLGEAQSEFVRFKTTRRAHYDAFTPTAPGVFDTVLWNARGEITECTRGNIAMRVEGRWVTPPLACGLLPGVGRALALREGRLAERVVRTDELASVQAWAFVNSLRGWIDAALA